MWRYSAPGTMQNPTAKVVDYNQRLPPDINRALFVRNLPFDIKAEEMYDIFGKFGAIRQIRLGKAKDTRGTAFVVYEDIYDAKNARESLKGFQVAKRYLVVLYHQQTKSMGKLDRDQKRREVDDLKKKFDSMRAKREEAKA